MGNPFGAPIAMGGASAGIDTPVDPSLDQQQQDTAAIDMNDPALTSESLSDDTSKDAYAAPPPPPDGKWRSKLKLAKIKDKRDGQEKDFIATAFPRMANGRPFFAVNIDVVLSDLSGTFDGVKLTEYWVKSLIDDRKHTSQMSTITTKAGGVMPAQSTDRIRLDTMLKTLASEPDVIVETQWEASCQTCQDAAEKKGERAPKPFLYGMHRFPQLRAGGADPNVACPVCKAMVRAQVRITGFLSLAEAKATRGLA